MSKMRILTKKFSIFRHIALKRMVIMIQGRKIQSKFCTSCFKTSYQIWSRLEHVLWLNYVLFKNSKSRKFRQNPLKINFFKIRPFTHWLITQHLEMIELWSIPDSIAHNLTKKMRGRWMKSSQKWKQDVKSKTTNVKKHHVCMHLFSWSQ